MMAAANSEVLKLMHVRNNEILPAGYRIEFAFADKHSQKDGPSAAVACALMAESIITGVQLDQGFAVTGDITATGEVRPIGGVDAKLRGASRKDCTIFAVPAANKASISDVYITEGLDPVSNIQIIIIKDFNEALALARADKSEEVRKALDDFEKVRKSLKSNPRNASHPKVLELLKSILKTLPGHESARLVALHGMGKGPDKLSLSGSLAEIDKAASHLGGSMEDGSFMEKRADDPLWKNISYMEGLRTKVDKRTQPYLESFLKTGTFLKEHRGKNQFNAQLQREFKTVIGRIEIERNNLMTDRNVQEELMGE